MSRAASEAFASLAELLKTIFRTSGEAAEGHEEMARLHAELVKTLRAKSPDERMAIREAALARVENFPPALRAYMIEGIERALPEETERR